MRDNYYKKYNDRDNRGYRDEGKDMSPRIKPHTILPAPSILQAYEEISEGSVDRLMEMAEIEQTHRHEWEDKSLELYAKAHRIGQVYGLLISLSIITASLYVAVELHNMHLAMIIVIAGFFSLTVSSVLASRIRRYERKPRKFIPGMQKAKRYNNHNRYEEEAEL
jgi:uncharacterized membrane protein